MTKKYLRLGFSAISLSFLLISCQNNGKTTKGLINPGFPSGDTDYYQADPLAGHFHKPDVTRDIKWPEHPLGKIIMKTNNLGFRNDKPTAIQKAPETKRIIITGDSHTDGVIYNSESVAARLEEMLKTQYPLKKFEALNAGNGYFGPQNFLGTYYKLKNLQPDYFIVIVYTGNDFLDGIRIESENGRLFVPERKDDYYEDLWKVDNLYSGFTGQYLNQVKFFKSFPQYIDSAMTIMKENLSKINLQCRNSGTKFLVVLLPTKIDTEARTDSTRISEVFRLMNFGEQEIKENDQLTETLKSWLSDQQIPVVDLFPAFKNSKDILFWKSDYHLNHLGHEEMARQILLNGFLQFPD
jgi:hypothetical protein